MSTIEALNGEFGISGELNFSTHASGLTVVEIHNQQASAAISVQGAHLMSWQPSGEKAVIWTSPSAKLGSGKSMRGGIPVCWPWFGDHAANADYPAHGFVRMQLWKVVGSSTLENGETQITFEFERNETSKTYWPHATSLRYVITVGKTLQLELQTINNSAQDIEISEALHTYFNVSDVRNISIEGLNNCDYLDKTDGFKRKHQTGMISFAGEVDRVYLNTESDCVLVDPGMARKIRIEKRGSLSTVVWNPWIEKSQRMGDMGENGYLHIACIESGNAADNKIKLAPGAAHTLWVNYALED